MLKLKMPKGIRKYLGNDRNVLGDDTGASAIEFAFIFPFMMLLYFGMVDVTGLISANRRIVSSAATMADLVGQQRTSVLKSTIVDQYNAAYVIMQPITASNVRIELFGYRKVGVNITKIWQTNNGNSTGCGGDPDTSNMANLMTAGNDVIVARACTTYTPAVASFMGKAVMGATSFAVTQTISVRPRSSLTLNCYATTVAAGTLCS